MSCLRPRLRASFVLLWTVAVMLLYTAPRADAIRRKTKTRTVRPSSQLASSGQAQAASATDLAREGPHHLLAAMERVHPPLRLRQGRPPVLLSAGRRPEVEASASGGSADAFAPQPLGFEVSGGNLMADTSGGHEEASRRAGLGDGAVYEAAVEAHRGRSAAGDFLIDDGRTNIFAAAGAGDAYVTAAPVVLPRIDTGETGLATVGEATRGLLPATSPVSIFPVTSFLASDASQRAGRADVTGAAGGGGSAEAVGSADGAVGSGTSGGFGGGGWNAAASGVADSADSADGSLDVGGGGSAASRDVVVVGTNEGAMSSVGVSVGGAKDADDPKGTEGGGGIEPPWPPRANDAIAVAFVLVSFWCLAQIMVAKPTAHQLEKKMNQRGILERNLAMLACDIEEALTGLSESFASFAQLAFEERCRDFKRFLRAVAAEPWENCDDPDHFKAFRNFIAHWLSIFAECSKDPIEHPHVVVTDAQLNSCKSMLELVALLVDPKPGGTSGALDNRPVELLGPAGRAHSFTADGYPAERAGLSNGAVYGNLKDQSSPCPSCCANLGFCCCPGARRRRKRRDVPGAGGEGGMMRIASYKHCLLACVFFLSLAFAIVFFSFRKWLHFVAMACATLSLLIGVCQYENVDLLDHLEKEVEALKLEHAKTEERRVSIQELYDHAKRFADFWRYRTIPRLDIMKELQEILKDAPGYCAWPLLDGAVEKLQHIDQVMGPAELWYGENALHEGKLQLVGDQVAVCATRLHAEHRADKTAIPKILDGLNNAFGVVALRGMKAGTLVHAGWLGKESNPCLRGAVNSLTFAETRVKKFNLDPRWDHEELYFIVGPNDTTLHLDIIDRSAVFKDKALGGVATDFRRLEPGHWYTRREELLGSGTLEFEVCYATSAEDLTEFCNVDYQILCHNRACRFFNKPQNMMRKLSTHQARRWTRKIVRGSMSFSRRTTSRASISISRRTSRSNARSQSAPRGSTAAPHASGALPPATAVVRGLVRGDSGKSSRYFYSSAEEDNCEDEEDGEPRRRGIGQDPQGHEMGLAGKLKSWTALRSRPYAGHSSSDTAEADKASADAEPLPTARSGRSERPAGGGSDGQTPRKRPADMPADDTSRRPWGVRRFLKRTVRRL